MPVFNPISLRGGGLGFESPFLGTKKPPGAIQGAFIVGFSNLVGFSIPLSGQPSRVHGT
jgi:hypothetical protein